MMYIIKFYLWLSDEPPVQTLLHQCQQRGWESPRYQLVLESGPAHEREFQYSVIVNNTTFTTSYTSKTKKEAKHVTAFVCLQDHKCKIILFYYNNTRYSYSQVITSNVGLLMIDYFLFSLGK